MKVYLSKQDLLFLLLLVAGLVLIIGGIAKWVGIALLVGAALILMFNLYQMMQRRDSDNEPDNK